MRRVQLSRDQHLHNELVSPQESSAGQKWVPLVLFLATCALFAPAVDNQLLNWDDSTNFTENPHFRGLGAEQLKWMWTTFHMGPYQPLSWMSLALDYLIWGTDAQGRLIAQGFYVTNILLHSLNVVLVYWVGVRLLALGGRGWSASRNPRQMPAEKIDAERPIQGQPLTPRGRGGNASDGWRLTLCAAWGALLFGWHPLRVESVAWATERRDVLSLAFLLGSLLWYLRASEADAGSKSLRSLGIAWLLFVAALLSKVMGMTFPVLLLMLDIYPLRRLPTDPRQWLRMPESRRVLWEKIPFAVVSAGAMVLALHGQREQSSLLTLAAHPLVARLAVSAYGLVWYCLKTIWPANLSPLYPLDLPLNLRDPAFWLSGIAVIVVPGLLWRMRHRFPAGLLAWCAFGLLVTPVLGLTQTGPQITADRYAYLPCLPWAILAAGGLWSWLSHDATPLRIRVARVAGFAVVVILAGLTLQQLAYWRNDYALWQQALRVNERSAVAHHNLGRALAEAGRTREALEHYDRALQIRPAFADILMNRGNLRFEVGRKQAGVADLRLACQLNPGSARSHYNLAIVLAASFDDAGADGALQQAVTLDPANQDFYRDGVETVRRQRTEEKKGEG